MMESCPRSSTTCESNENAKTISNHHPQQQLQHDKQLQQLILAIDIGSSSTRCSVFGWDSANSKIVSSPSSSTLLSSCSARKVIRAIPSSGHFDPQVLLNAVDDVVDETLQRLRQRCSNESKDSNWTFEIVAVGFTSFVMNLVGVNHQGQPVGEEATLSYACHSPAVLQQVQALKQELGPQACDRIYQSTGAPIHAAYALAQLRVLYADKTEFCRRHVATWSTLASCCISNWMRIINNDHSSSAATTTNASCSSCTLPPISYSEASWTGLLNYQTCKYEPSVLKLLPEDCVKALPNLADFDEFNHEHLHFDNGDGNLNQSCSSSCPSYQNNPTRYYYYATKWPELRRARFLLGLGDGACANIGSKCTGPTRIACTVGTSAAARICLRLPIQVVSVQDQDHCNDNKNSNTNENTPFVKGLFCYRIDKSHILLGGALTDGGSVVDWLRQLLNLESPQAYENCLSKVEELANQDWSHYSTTSEAANNPTVLSVVPFFSGERNPGFRESATGAMLGLTLATRPEHLFKACLEGVTLRLNAIVTLLLQMHGRETSSSCSSSSNDDNHQGSNDSDVEILISGKALEANALWRQMLSDCTGTTVIFDPDTADGTSRGVACMAARALSSLPTTMSGTSSISTTRTTSTATDHHDLLPLEAIGSSSTVSKPRLAMALYWKRMACEQENFLQTITPLYGGSES